MTRSNRLASPSSVGCHLRCTSPRPFCWLLPPFHQLARVIRSIVVLMRICVSLPQGSFRYALLLVLVSSLTTPSLVPARRFVHVGDRLLSVSSSHVKLTRIINLSVFLLTPWRNRTQCIPDILRCLLCCCSALGM